MYIYLIYLYIYIYLHKCTRVIQEKFLILLYLRRLRKIIAEHILCSYVMIILIYSIIEICNCTHDDSTNEAINIYIAIHYIQNDQTNDFYSTAHCNSVKFWNKLVICHFQIIFPECKSKITCQMTA